MSPYNQVLVDIFGKEFWKVSIKKIRKAGESSCYPPYYRLEHGCDGRCSSKLLGQEVTLKMEATHQDGGAKKQKI